MKKSKKILAIFIPVIMVAVVALGVILPTSLADREDTETKTQPATIVYADGVEGSEEDTGASTASAGYKGGSIFLEPNSTFNMQGGTISGHKNKYGGAIYISNGATFTMTGGTIENNTADYGGAIYVEAGGHCYIQGGTIQNNKAKTAPAIYVEKGADVKVSDEAEVKDNSLILGPGQVSVSTIEVGKKGSGLKLHYLYYGNYPQTYVGDELNETLESWYTRTTPAKVQDFVNKAYADATGDLNRTFTSYKYTDGELYARGTSYRNSSGSSYTYKDNSTVKATGETAWFKVEPIKWIVLNYEEYLAGQPIEILAEEVLTGGIQFNESRSDGNDWNTSWIRNWLNSEFLNSAFNSEEGEAIQSTHLKNNISGGHNQSPDNTKYWPEEKETDDKIYLLTYYELTGSGRGNPLGSAGTYNYYVYCCPTDYALSNNSFLMISDNHGSYRTNNRLGTTYWWLRSAGTGYDAREVSYVGSFDISTFVNGSNGIRPALQLSL